MTNNFKYIILKNGHVNGETIKIIIIIYSNVYT